VQLLIAIALHSLGRLCIAFHCLSLPSPLHSLGRLFISDLSFVNVWFICCVCLFVLLLCYSIMQLCNHASTPLKAPIIMHIFDLIQNHCHLALDITFPCNPCTRLLITILSYTILWFPHYRYSTLSWQESMKFSWHRVFFQRMVRKFVIRLGYA